jgi:hypothetical protein
MEENNQMRKLGKAGIEVYKAKLSTLKKSLEHYTIFGSEKTDLLKSLKTAKEFLKGHFKDSMAVVDMYDNANIVYDPSGVEIQGDISGAINLLEGTIKRVDEQISQLKGKISEYETLLKKYEKQDKYCYDLHAILMHSGDAEGGHYYVFIRDREKDIWRKYNDEMVTEVSEKSVLQEAIGNSINPTSAYFLIYAAQNYLKEEMKRIDEHAVNSKSFISPNLSDIMNYYHALIPNKIMLEISKDNLENNLYLINGKSAMICNEIVKEYRRRYGKLISNKTLSQYPYWNLVSWLESKELKYYKYVLLDSIIREMNESTVTLDMLDRNSFFFKMLSKAMGIESNCSLAYLNLDSKESQQIVEEESKFHSCVIDQRIQYYILKLCLAKNWLDALHTLDIYLSNAFYYNESSKESMIDILRFMILRLMSEISLNIMNGKYKEATLVLVEVSKRTVRHVKYSDSHIEHFKRYIKFVIDTCSEAFPKVDLIQFNKELEAMQNQSVVRTLDNDKVTYELMNIIKQTRKELSVKWIEECKIDMVQILKQYIIKLQADNDTWYKWHKGISLNARVISNNDLLNDELTNNIDFRKAINKTN